MDVLGKRMKSARNKLKIDQKILAEKTGLSNVQISRYESGKRRPDPDTLAKIANTLDCTTDYLLGRTDNPKGIIYNNTNDLYEYLMDENNPIYFEGKEMTKEERQLWARMMKAARDKEENNQ